MVLALCGRCLAWSLCCDLLDVKPINQLVPIERLKNAANAAFFNAVVSVG
jgi:hypothetical protein